MENTPEAAPQGTEAAPQTAPTEPTKAEAPEINAEQVAKYLGTDAGTLSKFQKFVDANGQFDAVFEKVKAKISNPAPAPAPAPAQEQKPVEPAQSAAAPQEQEYKAPAGAINQNDWFVKDYFEKLADRKYNNISDYIYSGKVLTDMAELGIQYLLPNGAIDADKVNKFLTMKSETAPAKPSGATPEAAAAPTVDYVPVGESIKSIEEARAVIMQDAQLKRSGQAGHPSVQKAEEYLRNALSNGKK